MDTSKQPGIRITNILLAESIFRRQPTVAADFNVHYSFGVKNNIYNDRKNLVTEMIVTLNTEADSVYGRFVFVGLFEIEGEGNLSLEQFAQCNAPAIIFPYVREEIHSRSTKAGLPQILLPPVNMTTAFGTEGQVKECT